MRKWLEQPTVVARLVGYGCSAVIVGVLLSRYRLINDNFDLAYLTILPFFLVIALVKRKNFAVFLLISCGLLVGIWRGSAEMQSREMLSVYFGQPAIVSGRVMDDVSVGVDGSLRLKLSKIRVNSANYRGDMWVSVAPSSNTLQRSDTLQLRGFLQEGFGPFSASLVRAELVSYEKTSQKDYGLVVRDSFAASIARHIDQPELALGLGYLLGVNDKLPEDIDASFRLLGLTHIMVASGYNLTILVGYARKLLAKISRYQSLVFGIVLIVGFILISGFSASMARAGFVAGLSLLAWYYGRSIHPFRLLAITAAITLMIKPSYIWGDIGWYLSFAAFFGILVVAPLIHAYFWGTDRSPSMFRDLLLSTLSAQLMTSPIILYSFGSISAYSLLANALVLPTVPYAMGLLFITGLSGYISPLAAVIVAFFGEALLSYAFWVVDVLKNMPGVKTEFAINGVIVAAFYGLIYILISWLIHKTKYNFLNDKKVVDL